MTVDVGAPVAERGVSAGRRRTAVVASLAYLVFAGVILVIMPISVDSAGGREVVVGPWTGGVLVAACLMASTVTLSVIVFAVPARGWWWVLLGPLRAIVAAAAVVAAFGFTLTDESVTPIVANGCETGYVVTERSFLFLAAGEVRRVEGVIGTSVGSTSVDDGHKPFQEQSYIAVTSGDTLRIWNTFDNAWERLSTSTEPAFVLPRLVDETGCGLAGGVVAARPSASPSPVATVDEGPAPAPVSDSRDEIARMAQLTIEAAGTPMSDAEGVPVTAPAASDLPCDGTTSHDMTVRTDDNTSSYAAILDAWSAEGYSRDRAMQEDLRYNGVVRLSARDRSSLDGLMHFSLTADCRAP